MPPLPQAGSKSMPFLGSMIFTIIFTNDLGVKNTPSSEAMFLANLFKKYS